MQGMGLKKESSHPMLSSFPPSYAKKGKIVTAEEAVRIIRDGDTVATSGFVGAGFAEEVAVKLEEYFLKTGRPQNLTLVYAAGQVARANSEITLAIKPHVIGQPDLDVAADKVLGRCAFVA